MPTPHGEAPGGINVVYGEVVFPIRWARDVCVCVRVCVCVCACVCQKAPAHSAPLSTQPRTRLAPPNPTPTRTPPPSGPQAIVDLVAATLPPGTRLAVFDTVTSNTALLLPVAELTALCRSRWAAFRGACMCSCVCVCVCVSVCLCAALRVYVCVHLLGRHTCSGTARHARRRATLHCFSYCRRR